MDEPTPTSQQVRRALARVGRGASLDVAEAAVLLAARGEDLAALTDAAARVRDAGLVAAGRPGVVTYSPKVFIPLTRLCRDRCHYCTFVTVPGKLAAAGQSMYLSPDEVLAIASAGAAQGCTEALFTLGDRPEDRWPEARQWLDEHGYDSTLDYLRAMAVRVLEETGLLPHLNPGVMSWAELNRLKPVSPSMGMMLETTSTRLFTERGQPHHGSPDKDPAVRLRVLEDAGRLSVPFTTGILVGIGETLHERAESIFAIRRVARDFGHVQEVIVQNFRAKPDTAMRTVGDLGLEEYLAAIAVTRIVLGPRMRVQAPPNLVDLAECAALLGAGVDDFGGVSPVTPDHVNPERPWPDLDRLRAVSADCRLHAARPAHRPPRARPAPASPGSTPGCGATSTPWPGPTASRVADPRPVGLPWQEPDGGFAESGGGTGRTDLHTTIDTLGRTADRRADFDDVYGDWQSLRDQVADDRTADPAPRAPGPDPVLSAALRQAERDPRSLTDEQALALMTADGAGLEEVCRIADDLRARDGRRRRDLRRQPEHQLHQRLLHRLPVLRLRAAAHRRRRLLAVPGAGRRPGRGGLGARRHRGLHAGRDRPGAAGHGVLRPGLGGQAAGPGDARARVLARWRSSTAPPGPGCRSTTGCSRPRRPAWTPSRARPRRSSTTTSAGS